jgi:hypothetical protein
MSHRNTPRKTKKATPAKRVKKPAKTGKAGSTRGVYPVTEA